MDHPRHLPLVVWALIGIAVVVALITQFKVHPFIALILGSGTVGLGAGLAAADVIKQFEGGFKQFEGGFGSTLGGVGILVALGTMLGAGGGFKQVLVSIGIGDALGKAAAASGLSALVLGWLVAVGIRLATGSATVATVTAAGLMAPLVEHLGHVNKPLLALAIGAGPLFLSHVNNAGFWLVKEYFGMTVGQTFKTWSAMETIISVVSFVLILLLGLVV